MLIKVIVT